MLSQPYTHISYTPRLTHTLYQTGFLLPPSVLRVASPRPGSFPWTVFFLSVIGVRITVLWNFICGLGWVEVYSSGPAIHPPRKILSFTLVWCFCIRGKQESRNVVFVDQSFGWNFRWPKCKLSVTTISKFHTAHNIVVFNAMHCKAHPWCERRATYKPLYSIACLD